jgi:hypothetical protein
MEELYPNARLSSRQMGRKRFSFFELQDDCIASAVGVEYTEA